MCAQVGRLVSYVQGCDPIELRDSVVDTSLLELSIENSVSSEVAHCARARASVRVAGVMAATALPLCSRARSRQRWALSVGPLRCGRRC